MLTLKVLGVQGAKVKITDGTKEMVVAKKQLDEKIADGSVQIANLKVKCVEKIRDKNNNIINYKIADNKGEEIIVDAKQLKEKIKAYQVECLNLTLTSDNRLVDREGAEVAKITGGKTETPTTPVKPSVQKVEVQKPVIQKQEQVQKVTEQPKPKENTQTVTIECGAGVGESTYIIISSIGDTYKKHKHSYYKEINTDATRLKFISDSSHKTEVVKLN